MRKSLTNQQQLGQSPDQSWGEGSHRTPALLWLHVSYPRLRSPGSCLAGGREASQACGLQVSLGRPPQSICIPCLQNSWPLLWGWWQLSPCAAAGCWLMAGSYQLGTSITGLWYRLVQAKRFRKSEAGVGFILLFCFSMVGQTGLCAALESCIPPGVWSQAPGNPGLGVPARSSCWSW